MKKFLGMGVLLAMTVMAAGCTGQKAQAPETATTQAAATQVEAAAEDWYKTVLEDEATKKDYPFYALLDINQDGQDELFLSTTEDHFIGDEQKACLMAYDQGEVKTLQEIGGAGGEYWIYSQSDAVLSYFSRLSGESHIVLEKLENGELKEVSKADYYGPHHYAEEDNEEALYIIDGEKVSTEDGESYWEQYGNDAGALTYEKY